MHNPERAHGLPSSYDDSPVCITCKDFMIWYGDGHVCFDCEPPECEMCDKPIDRERLVCVNPECEDAAGEFEPVREPPEITREMRERKITLRFGDEVIVLGGTQ